MSPAYARTMDLIRDRLIYAQGDAAGSEMQKLQLRAQFVDDLKGGVRFFWGFLVHGSFNQLKSAAH